MVEKVVKGRTSYALPFYNKKHFRTMGKFQRNKKKAADIRHPRVIEGKNTALYIVWQNMKQRCFNRNTPKYPLWGGKGITVCEDWMDFDNFADWMLANDWRKGLSIDRIDPGKNYGPENCQIVTRAENSARVPVTEARRAASRRCCVFAALANRKKIRCIETGEVFDSMTIAANHVGGLQGGIRYSVKTGNRCKGYRWEYVEK